MKKKAPIRNRNNNKLTQYFPAGRTIKLSGIGDFPALLKDFDEDGEMNGAFKLAAVTDDFIYYADEEKSDETASIIMLNRDMKLISDNFFASNDFVELIGKNEGLLWISRAVKYNQRLGFVQPEKLTAEIRKRLNKVDITNLKENERAIYLAYLNSDHVKYTKPESLMAVISNDVNDGEFSTELAAIVDMLD